MALELGPDDLEAILAPIPGDQPVGIDLREDHTPTSIYYRLRDARADARAAERQADSPERQDAGGGEEALQGKWRPVATMATAALKESTKDLEIASWLTEALVRMSGLEGLKAGALVIAGLVEQYWAGLFPLPEEGEDMELRLSAIGGLSGQGADGTLMQPLRKLPLFTRPDGSAFCLWHYQSTLDLAKVVEPERRAQRIQAGAVPFDDVEKEARLAGKAHWSDLQTTVVEAMAPWEAMGRALDEKAGPASPSGIRVREALQLMLDTCKLFVPETDKAEAAPAPAGGQPAVGATTGPVVAATAPGAVVNGPIAGRDHAIRQLEEVAGWFKRNEPNSPIGYTLDEAVRRARMAWPELVAELIADEGSRAALLTSVGMRRPDAPGSE